MIDKGPAGALARSKAAATSPEWEAAMRSPAGAKLDWDAIVAAGEAQLAMMSAAGEEREFIVRPLAVAYHQRASRSWARGDALAALGDVDRAIEIDPFFLSYRTTRAVLLDALGRRVEAYDGIDTFLLLAEAHRRWHTTVHAWQTSSIQGKELREGQAIARADARRSTRELADAADDDVDRLLDFGGLKDSLNNRELARAHATRGLIAFREGNLVQARLDLRRAMELQPNAFHAHSLGAALYACNDVAGAAEAEERSVALAPSNARYRWALVLSLRKLGRSGEAREHAERILQMGPRAAAAYRERIARLF
jgi:tetratricopeptide (TPR) repeat protein